MDSTTHSSLGPAERPDRLARLTAAVEALDGRDLAARDLDGLAVGVRAEPTLQLPQLLHRLEGHWLQHLAPWTPAAPPGPSWASRWARPRPGCGPAPAGRRRRPSLVRAARACSADR